MIKKLFTFIFVPIILCILYALVIIRNDDHYHDTIYVIFDFDFYVFQIKSTYCVSRVCV